VTSAFRGAAHEVSNRNYRLTEKIFVIFHNLRDYDSHFIIEEIGKFEKLVGVISNNKERYVAFFR